MWKTLIALGLAAGLGFLSCQGVVDSDVIPSSSAPAIFGTSDDVNAIAYGNGIFVAGGEHNRMAYSTDGYKWIAINQSIVNAIYAIAYGNGKFVMFGSSGSASVGSVMAYSTDGINWTAINLSIFINSTNKYAIAYGSGIFVAGTVYGKMLYSADGINWTVINQSIFGTTTITAIIYENGKFIAGGGSKMAYSTDGINWTAINQSAINNIRTIAYGNGKFVAGSLGDGEIAYSTDGINWTAVTQSLVNSTHSIAYGNGKFVVGSALEGKMIQSTDGINWTIINQSVFGTTDVDGINAVIYANGRFVACGYYGKIAYWPDESPIWLSRAGFLEKHITASATKYKLFDGKWLSLNSGGGVTWNEG